MDPDSTKSEISEISASQTIQILATIVSAITQAVEGMKSELKTKDKNRRKREDKAIKSRIQRIKLKR